MHPNGASSGIVFGGRQRLFWDDITAPQVIFADLFKLEKRRRNKTGHFFATPTVR
jgi:hypothetical protein